MFSPLRVHWGAFLNVYYSTLVFRRTIRTSCERIRQKRTDCSRRHWRAAVMQPATLASAWRVADTGSLLRAIIIKDVEQTLMQKISSLDHCIVAVKSKMHGATRESVQTPTYERVLSDEPVLKFSCTYPDCSCLTFAREILWNLRVG